MTDRLYYDPSIPSAFSSLKKLQTAAKEIGKKPGDIKAWLEKQDAYTLHRPLRKRFPRNPYAVNNIMDVWECDLIDVQAVSKLNESYKYLLTAIDVFSKFLNVVPLKSKMGPAVTSAFQSILKNPKYSTPLFKKRPIWVRTDRGKEFVNKNCQDMLKREGIQFQVCRNPDVKCSVVERAQHTLREKLYGYFTYKNTHRHIDVLPRFVRAHNDTMHSAIGMAPSKVTDSSVLAIWKKKANKNRHARRVIAKFHIGQHVRIIKEKMKFSKGAEQNYSTEIFRITSYSTVTATSVPTRGSE